jgi:type I restriction enzyme M protein
MFGQELNPESYAICKADMLIKGQDIGNIVARQHALAPTASPRTQFDYMLSNPPFGVEVEEDRDAKCATKHEEKGYDGRFGPGLPRVSDGSLLVPAAPASARCAPPKDGGSRFGIVLNGSPLFTGGAGSGESEIRRHMLENDLVEAIVGLPTDMFYNTGIATYVWIARPTASPTARKGKVQLIDAGELLRRRCARASAASARSSPTRTSTTSRALFGNFEKSTRDGAPISRIFKNEDFGYRTITVERPERDAKGQVVLATKGKAKGKPAARRRACATPRTCRSPRTSSAYFDTRGAASRRRRMDRRRQDQGRLRDSVQPPLLRVQAAASAGRDRRRLEGRDGRDPRHGRGTLEVISGSDRTANAGTPPSV